MVTVQALPLFLMLSCAECERLEIFKYLRKINDVPSSFPIGNCALRPDFGVKKILPEIPFLWEGYSKGGSVGTCCPPLLQRASGQRSTTLPHPPLNRRCTNSRY